MYKSSTKHVFFYFHCIGTMYYLLYILTTTTFDIILFIVIYYKMYNIIYGIVSYNLSLLFPIKVYEYFILKQDSHHFGTYNELFIYFCNLVAIYLNIWDTPRNRTNHGIVVFWCFIGVYVLLSIYPRRSC